MAILLQKNIESYFCKNKFFQDCYIEWVIESGNTTREGSGKYFLIM